MLGHLARHIHHNVAPKGERDGLKSDMIETISSRALVTEEGSETKYVESAKIYILVDPRDQEIRYVGKTESSLDDRLYHHIWDAASGTSKAHKARWLRKLRRLGYQPTIVLVQEVPTIYWPDAERYWIAHYRSIGCPLTNATDGGDSGPTLPGELNPFFGRTHSQESRAKISQANTGVRWTDEARANLSAVRKASGPNAGTFQPGCEVPENIRQARSQRMTGVPMDDEVKAKISAALKGKPKVPCGHDDWQVRPNGTRYCRTCAHERYVYRRDQKAD